jgi:hypothetical protein
VGYYSDHYINLTEGAWEEYMHEKLTVPNLLEDKTLAMIMTFNIYNPNVNMLAVFRYIF